MGHHAVIGTHRRALDVPRAVQDLDGTGEVETVRLEDLSGLYRLQDARGVGDDDAAGSQRLGGVGDDPPGLGQIEHHAIEVP